MLKYYTLSIVLSVLFMHEINIVKCEKNYLMFWKPDPTFARQRGSGPDDPYVGPSRRSDDRQGQLADQQSTENNSITDHSPLKENSAKYIESRRKSGDTRQIINKVNRSAERNYKKLDRRGKSGARQLRDKNGKSNVRHSKNGSKSIFRQTQDDRGNTDDHPELTGSRGRPSLRKAKLNASPNKTDKSKETGGPAVARARGPRTGTVAGSGMLNYAPDQDSDKDNELKLLALRGDQKKRSRRASVQSTRMPPMYMMQQQNKAEKQHLGENSNEDYILSPYSIAQKLEKLCDKYPNTNITSEVIGRTAEYNDIVLLKVTQHQRDVTAFFRADENKYEDVIPEKKIVFIVHGLSVMGIKLIPCFSNGKKFQQLLSYYFKHLDKFDIFLIPLANPDGVSALTSANEFASSVWNKNMSPQDACQGVALDRNFDVAWDQHKVLSSCSQQYPGPQPFSEPETRAIRDVFHRYSNKIVAYMHVHAGTCCPDVFKGDAILYPKGYSEVQSEDDKYIDLRGEIDEAMRNASFQVLGVAVETLHNWYGKVTGTSVDYATTVYGLPFAVELVMQIYQDDQLVENPDDRETNSALTEVWSRVIDVVFNSIYKISHPNNEVKK